MIVLRAVEPADGDALHAIFTEPGVQRYLLDDVVPTRAETQQHVDAARQQGASIVVQDGEVVGLVALRPAGPDRELIIAVSERLWGRGIAFDAAMAVMQHGFETLGLPRIVAAVDLPNERSHRLMERLGFAATGEVDGPKYRARTYVAVNATASSTNSKRS